MLAYRLLIILLAPFILTHLLWKSLRLGQSRFLLQRLGFGINHIPQGCLWFHCASVGETNTVMPLIRALHKQNPAQNILITTNTVTGAEIVAKQNQSWLFHAYLPMDWMSTVKRFFNQTRPAGLYIMETELWPNLVAIAHQRQIPASIINGRLSKKTTHTKQWVRSVYRQTLACLEHIYVRSEKDRELYVKLGASEEQLTVLGNLKFTPPGSQNIKPQSATSRDYVVLASSHENEELQITQRWKQLGRKELLVIAPRHPERSEAILKQLNNVYDTASIAVRSRNDSINEQTHIYLLDTVGELMNWFPAAKLVIMAGSFIHRGGHNILEPAHLGKAVIFGPHMESFVDESEVLLANQAAIQVSCIDELKAVLGQLLSNSDVIEHLEEKTAEAIAPFANVVDAYTAAITQ